MYKGCLKYSHYCNKCDSKLSLAKPKENKRTINLLESEILTGIAKSIAGKFKIISLCNTVPSKL